MFKMRFFLLLFLNDIGYIFAWLTILKVGLISYGCQRFDDRHGCLRLSTNNDVLITIFLRNNFFEFYVICSSKKRGFICFFISLGFS